MGTCGKLLVLYCGIVLMFYFFFLSFVGGSEGVCSGVHNSHGLVIVICTSRNFELS